jgi:hypothetical protein
MLALMLALGWYGVIPSEAKQDREKYCFTAAPRGEIATRYCTQTEAQCETNRAAREAAGEVTSPCHPNKGFGF